MQKPAALIALLVVGAGLATWFATRSGSAAEARPVASAQRATEPGVAAARAPDAASAATTERANAPAAPVAPVVEPAAASSEHHQPVQVVVAASGEPVPGARIQWASNSEYGAAWKRDRDREFAAGILESGRVLLADTEGRARVPRPDGLTYYVVAHEGLYAEGTLEGYGLDPARIELAPDWDLAVEVVDAAGFPVVGAHVELRSGPREIGVSRWAGKTAGEPPLAVLTHAPALFERAGSKDALFADAYMPLPAGVDLSVSVPLDAPPAAPLRLQLPQTGSLELRLVDERGQLIRESASVGLQRIDPATSETNPRAWPQPGHVTNLHVPNGVLELPCVGLGLELKVNVWPHDERQRVERTIAGPRSPGERVTASIELAETWPILVGRLVDEGGEPLSSQLASGYFSMAVPGESASATGTFAVSCEADGSFRTRVPFLHKGATQGYARFRVKLDGVDCEAEVQFDAPQGSEQRDLGDVVLAPSPLVVSGFVRDAQGIPLSGAKVSLEREHVRLSNGQHHPHWKPEFEFTTRCAPDGSFALYGAVPEGALRLRVVRDGYRPPSEQTPFERGATDVVIVLQGAVSVAGNLLLPAGAPAWPFEVQVRGSTEGASASAGLYQSRRLNGDGSFTLDNVTYGPWNLEVALRNDADPLLVLSDVVVSPATGQATPSLEGIDLRGLVRGIAIEVVDPEGEPVAEGWVRPLGQRARPGYDAPPAHSLNASTASLWVRPVPIDIEVHVPGYRDVVLDNVVGDRRVVLQAATQVRLDLPVSVELPSGRRELRAMLLEQSANESAGGFPIVHEGRHVARSGRDPFVLSPAFDASRTVVMSVPRSGSYSVRFVLRTIDDDGEESRHVRTEGDVPALEIAEESAQRTVVAEPEREAYATWLQSFEEL